MEEVLHVRARKTEGESGVLFHIVWQIPARVAVVSQIGRFLSGVLLLELVDNFSGQGGNAFPGHELIPIHHTKDREDIKSNFFK